jgi:hypothetical protein
MDTLITLCDRVFALLQVQFEKVGLFHGIFIILCVNAMVVNYRFGHPTYWRKSSFPQIPHISSYDKLSLSEDHIEQWDLERVHPDLLLNILGYLNAQELTVIAQVSRKYRILALNHTLWGVLIRQLPIPESMRVNLATLGADDSIAQYFKLIEDLSTHILSNQDKIIVKLHGDLYDLTHFEQEHPGGPGVLVEYKGKDATKMFELASHSTFARELSQNLICFSPAEFIGAPGLPAFAHSSQTS